MTSEGWWPVDGTQLVKGVLDLAVLAVVAREDGYGYDVVRRLRSAGLEEVGRRLRLRHAPPALLGRRAELVRRALATRDRTASTTASTRRGARCSRRRGRRGRRSPRRWTVCSTRQECGHERHDGDRGGSAGGRPRLRVGGARLARRPAGRRGRGPHGGDGGRPRRAGGRVRRHPGRAARRARGVRRRAAVRGRAATARGDRRRGCRCAGAVDGSPGAWVARSRGPASLAPGAPTDVVAGSGGRRRLGAGVGAGHRARPAAPARRSGPVDVAGARPAPARAAGVGPAGRAGRCERARRPPAPADAGVLHVGLHRLRPTRPSSSSR